NRGFMRRMRDGVPLVAVKVGMTMDAKIALETGASQWITSAAARADVQRLRAASGAIVTGVGTVLADDPALTVRGNRFDNAGMQPLRVILDTHLRSPSSSRIFREAGETLVFTASTDARRTEALQALGAVVESCPVTAAGLDLEVILQRLAAREVNEVLVEAGPAVVGAFVRDHLFDDLVIYLAPKIFGNSATGTFALPALLNIDSATELEIVNVRKVGPDLRITMRSHR
ncbi:MAG: bifunctional diaminohydroxyphosphoribosylaminopyrimidine deaminase/5-amino-6-(5-phosphoribosylamino)uracil reductase RibD, partial [Gammaproteobacteria bacterium]